MSDKRDREFIHAMASPLAGIEMILESVIEDLEGASDELMIGERVKDSLKGIERLRTLLAERREEIINGK